MALCKPPILLNLLKEVEASKCPLCGDDVFIPKKGFQMNGSTSENPTVFCKDMGHWVGYLSDTVKK